MFSAACHTQYYSAAVCNWRIHAVIIHMDGTVDAMLTYMYDQVCLPAAQLAGNVESHNELLENQIIGICRVSQFNARLDSAVPTLALPS